MDDLAHYIENWTDFPSTRMPGLKFGDGAPSLIANLGGTIILRCARAGAAVVKPIASVTRTVLFKFIVSSFLDRYGIED
jgi:hypothetical protein